MATQQDNWAAVKALFEAALEEDAANRASFLKQHCPDATVCAEVERLLAEHDQAASFLSTPALVDVPREAEARAPRLSENEMLAGRFRIIRFIASGGMGEVYEAEDQELHEHVALKTIRPEILVQPDAMARFKREVHLARQVTHPNVCRIFDLFRQKQNGGNVQEGAVFISMELLNGRTLAAHLQQHGSMDCNQALPLVSQMVSALAAAHQLGIVHRDFKPGNVMLVGHGTQTLVKVTDFGLARSLRPEDNSTLSHTEVVGTPSYMAPEQFRGQYGPETDVYALGLTIFEMLTAKLPTSRHAPFKDVHNDPPKTIGSRWQRVITKCIAVEPSERFREVQDVWRILSGSNSTEYFGVPAFVSVVKRHAIAVGGVSLLLIALLALLWGSLPNLLRPLPEQKHIAVLSFRNIGNDAADQAFTDGVVESLTSKLSQLERFQKSFWVVPSTDTRQIKSLDDAYRKLNVTLAITGSIQHTGTGVILTSNLVDAKNHKQLASRTIRARSADLEELQSRVWQSVADMIDLQISPEAAVTVNLGETKLPGAYELYEQGVGYSQRFDEDSLGHAIDLFNGALSRDPGYALAYAGLATAYTRKYRLTKDPQWIKVAILNGQHALQLSDQLVPAHIAMGQVYLETGQLNGALLELQRALDEDPSAISAAYLIGKVYEKQGKFVEAEKALKSIVDRRPGYWTGYSGLGTFYYKHGEFDKAARQFQAMIDLQPDNSIGYHDLGAVYMAMARYDDAVNILKKGLALKETSSGWSNLGSAYMYLNRYAEAVDAVQKATTLDPHNDVLWRNLGDGFRQLPSRASDATAAYEKALHAAIDELSVDPSSTEALSGIALYDAHLGHKEDAETSIKKAIGLSPKDSDVLFTSALVYEIIGDRDRALRAIERAVNSGYSIEEIEHEPELRALRSDPRYKTARGAGSPHASSKE
jgi:serine/threonine protein kinase/Flp pilus assembly protein TadD